MALRERLQCKNFEWYLDNVYPEMRRYNNTVYYGEVSDSLSGGQRSVYSTIAGKDIYSVNPIKFRNCKGLWPIPRRQSSGFAVPHETSSQRSSELKMRYQDVTGRDSFQHLIAQEAELSSLACVCVCVSLPRFVMPK